MCEPEGTSRRATVPRQPVRRTRRAGRRCRRGATMVEFAIVAPVMFLVVLGAIEMYRLIMVAQLAESAAMRGAREAAKVATDDAGSVNAWVTDYLRRAGIAPEAVTVTVRPNNLASLDAGTDVAVSVRIRFADVTWLPAMFVPADARVSASAARTRE